MSSFFATIGVLVLALPMLLLIALLSTMWRAWWLYPAWGWFVVPLGVSTITFWHFVAFLLLCSILTSHSDDKKDDRKTDWGKLVVVFIWPVFVWILLWWVHV